MGMPRTLMLPAIAAGAMGASGAAGWVLAEAFGPPGGAAALACAAGIAAIAGLLGRRASARGRLLQAALDIIPCHLAVFARDGHLVAWNSSYRALHAAHFDRLAKPLTYRALMRATVAAAFPPDEVEAELERRVRRHETSDGDAFDQMYPGGSWMRVCKKRLATGEVAGFALDITSLKQAQREVERSARHDPLTGLPNRILFTERLAILLASAQSFALLLIDLDHFKAANDRHGHAVGDALLVAAAARMRTVIREADLVCRLGGDEFAVLMADEPCQVAPLAERLLDTISAPFLIEGHEIRISASIGVGRAPKDGITADVLLRAADAALYRVKRAGRAGVAEAADHARITEPRAANYSA